MNKNELLNVLIKTDPFEILEPEVLKKLSNKLDVRKYAGNSYVFKQGEPSMDALFIIASGLVELVVSNEKGDETLIGLKRQYDFFGETVVLSRQRYPASARVKQELTCCLIFREDLEKIMYNYPEFSGFFNALLTERLRMLYEEISVERSYNGSGVSSINAGFFRNRVSEIMSYPVITCRTSDMVTRASKTMDDKNINAIVALDNENKPRGILTEKNLVKYLIAQQMYPVESCRVENIMNSNLVEIKPQAFVGQALVAMMRSKTKHLIVMERGELLGIVSMVDLMKTQSAGTLQLTKDIESQPDMKGLTLVNREIQNILKAMAEEEATIHEVFDVMSELRERLTRRVIQLSEESMKLEGWGGPPVEYCWIHMGSAARYEQTFNIEQDNAMIYADPEEGEVESVYVYFKRLAELIVENLEKCGFARCDLGIMAVNDRWRRSLTDWVTAVKNWSEFPVAENAKKMLILLDYRPIWGNLPLAEIFRQKLFESFRICNQSNFSMPEDDIEYRPPISFLGTFLTENSGIHKNEMNLKTSAISHIVNCARIMAAQNDISEPSTLGRLKLLMESGIISEEDGELFINSFESLIKFQIVESCKKVKQGKRPDNYIDPYSLRKRERMILKDALSGVSRILEIINEKTSGFWLKHL